MKLPSRRKEKRGARVASVNFDEIARRHLISDYILSADTNARDFAISREDYKIERSVGPPERFDVSLADGD